MWFFKIADRDVLDDAIYTMVESLDVDAVYVEQEQPFGVDESGHNIPSIMN